MKGQHGTLSCYNENHDHCRQATHRSNRAWPYASCHVIGKGAEAWKDWGWSWERRQTKSTLFITKVSDALFLAGKMKCAFTNLQFESSPTETFKHPRRLSWFMKQKSEKKRTETTRKWENWWNLSEERKGWVECKESVKEWLNMLVWTDWFVDKCTIIAER